LTGRQIADTARRSTERYLTFLKEQGRGVEKHDVEGIRRLDDRQQLLEGSVWHAYACNLQPGLKVRGNTGGILQCGSRADLEVRILQYDRRSGKTEIATREDVDCTTGRLLIDFRWLVRRTLEWYREHGSSLPSLAEIAPPTRPAAQLAQDSGLGSEQEQAINIALTAPLTYIWGPPGTGKTKWVLAKAVELCVSAGEKTLVLAPTNNAVDNALRAILDEGVSSNAVLRIGVPTKQFLADFPDCCEERAFASEIAELSAQVRALEKRIARIKKGRELQNQTRELRDFLDVARQELAKKETEDSQLDAALGDLENRLASLRESLTPRERELEALESQRANLGVAKLRENIDALEEEQTRAIKERSELQQSLGRVGFFTKLLTNRRQKITDQIASATSHLHATESTLERQRAKLAELIPALEVLESKRARLLESCQAEWNQEKELKSIAAAERTKKAKLAADIAQLKKSWEGFESRIGKAETELSELEAEGISLDEDNEKLEKQLEMRKEALAAQLAMYKQDMANKAVLGMTLDGFIGLTLQMGLSVDRVFIDEAPYAPLAKCIPLLSLQRPLTLLGDHLQLPPICEWQQR
jgi:septal ring factor EnvC (AmiA/AmiB activator)